MKKHFKENWLIYATIATCAFIIALAIFIKKDDELEEVDTHLMNVVSLKEVLQFFEEDKPRLLILSVHDCQATVNYVPNLVIAAAKQEAAVNYLELSEIDPEKDIEDFNKFMQYLDYEYTFQGQTGPIRNFIENTPVNLIIKNKKVVYAYIGSMGVNALESILKLYGV